MKVIIQIYTTIGSVKPKNEDAFEIINNLDSSNKSNIPILYAGLFDGHGGGDISKTLINKEKINLSKYFCSIESPISQKLLSIKSNKMIEQLFTRVQEKLKNYYIRSNSMGSTASISLIYPKKNKYAIKVINLGDCRTVICNSYNIGNQLSLDHKPHLYSDNQRIINMGGILEFEKGDDPRINGMSVSRSFGDLDNKFISQKPDIFDYDINNDKFLIIGCDGLWDVLQNQDAVDFVLSKYNKNIANIKTKSENNIAYKLSELALNKGSQDNITVIIIFFTE
jgi:serine/threonine protein phosphatase PrpC